MVIQSEFTITSDVLQAILAEAFAIPSGTTVRFVGAIRDDDSTEIVGDLCAVTVSVKTNMDGARKIERRVKKLGIEEKSGDGQE